MTQESPPPSEIQEKLTAYWNTRSTQYDSTPGHDLHGETYLRAWREALTELLPAAPADILDVGTGTGFLALFAAQLGHRVVGIDVAENMLAIARDKAAEQGAQLTFQLGDAAEPPFAPESFDAIVSRHVTWTLPDPGHAFARWHDLLRPGGRVVAIDGLWGSAGLLTPEDKPENPEWHDHFMEWTAHYSSATLAELPLSMMETLDPALALVRAAGFADARIVRLPEIERIELESLRDARGVTVSHGAIVAVKPSM